MPNRVEWMSVGDFCDRVGVVRSTYDRWKVAGQLPRHRKLPSGKVLFDSRDVDDWLDAALVEA